MPSHTVQQGECLRSIADHYGWSSWLQLYDHPDNESLRELRPDPEVLLAGDTVAIPDEPPEPMRIASPNRLTPVDLRGVTTAFGLTLVDPAGEPLAGKNYTLQIDGSTFDGVLDDAGAFEEHIPMQASDGHSTVWLDDDRSWDCAVQIGHLDPLDTVSGVQARLRALGYSLGRVDGDAGVWTAEAVLAFQEDHDLSASGEIDDATRAKLAEVHGC